VLGQKTLQAHDRLMSRMAETLGADLDEVAMRGDLPPELRLDMLKRCTGCSAPGACSKWLDAHATADAPPSYCRNSDALSTLRRG